MQQLSFKHQRKNQYQVHEHVLITQKTKLVSDLGHCQNVIAGSQSSGSILFLSLLQIDYIDHLRQLIIKKAKTLQETKQPINSQC